MWAGVGGTAYHACIRAFEEEHHKSPTMLRHISADDIASEATYYADRFAVRLAHAIADQVMASTVPMSAWYAADNGKENRDWWLEQGPQMVHRYITAQRGRTTQPLTLPDGRPALEIEAEMTLGAVPVHGFIDRIMWEPASGKIIVEDDKAGARWPQDHAQIDFYGWWVREVLVPSLPWADKVREVWVRYWAARKGEYILVAQVGKRTSLQSLAYRYAQLDQLDRSGVYLPQPSSMCKACPVRSSCPEGDGTTDVYELLLTSQHNGDTVARQAIHDEGESMSNDQEYPQAERRAEFVHSADTEEGRAERRAAEATAPTESEGFGPANTGQGADADERGKSESNYDVDKL